MACYPASGLDPRDHAIQDKTASVADAQVAGKGTSGIRLQALLRGKRDHLYGGRQSEVAKVARGEGQP